jgi:hypothetical protein
LKWLTVDAVRLSVAARWCCYSAFEFAVLPLQELSHFLLRSLGRDERYL